MNGSIEIGTNNELSVWIYPESSADPVHCGVLELIRGRLCRFEYAPAWLARADAFELSPDLPLHAGKFEPDAGLNIHPIFADAGPDRVRPDLDTSIHRWTPLPPNFRFCNSSASAVWSAMSPTHALSCF